MSSGDDRAPYFFPSGALPGDMPPPMIGLPPAEPQGIPHIELRESPVMAPQGLEPMGDEPEAIEKEKDVKKAGKKEKKKKKKAKKGTERYITQHITKHTGKFISDITIHRT